MRAVVSRPRPAPPVALYVHVPYCVSICPYCDFVVVAGSQTRGPGSSIPRFIRAVMRELKVRADGLDANFGASTEVSLPSSAEVPRPLTAVRPRLRSLYIGGGTPTLLPPEAIAELIGLVDRRFGLEPGAEITIEANPDPDERGDLTALVDAGITRISFGAQALDDSTLRRLGRRHHGADVATAVAAARSAGVPSVSIDLLYDVPEQSLAGWAATLDAVIALSPDHVSAYALTLDDPDAEGLTGPSGDHLPLRSGARTWRRRAAAGQDEDRAAAQYALAVDRLAGAGFRGYEISNWARPGHESRHNLAYWRREPYEAVGPGAHAFDGSTRRWNGARLDAYLAALDPTDGGEPSLPPGGAESIDIAGADSETAILSLRLDEGVPIDVATAGPLAQHLDWGFSHGLLERVAAPDGPAIRLTTNGRLLSNELFARLI